MSMNKNKIEYYYENNDILQAKIKRLINENLDREEDILNKVAEDRNTKILWRRIEAVWSYR